MGADEAIRAIPVLDYETPARGTILLRLRRIVTALFFVLIGAAAGMLIAWAIAPLSYISTGLIYVTPPNMGVPLNSNFLYTQAANVTGPANSIAARASVAPLGITKSDWYDAQIDSEVMRKSDVIRISVTHSNADTARQMANALIRQMNNTAGNVSVIVIEPPLMIAPRPHRSSALILAGGIAGAVAVILIRRHRTARARGFREPIVESV